MIKDINAVVSEAREEREQESQEEWGLHANAEHDFQMHAFEIEHPEITLKGPWATHVIKASGKKNDWIVEIASHPGVEIPLKGYDNGNVGVFRPGDVVNLHPQRTPGKTGHLMIINATGKPLIQKPKLDKDLH